MGEEMNAMEGKGHPALTDAQTGLPNELHWDTVFGIVFAAAIRGIPLTLIFLEIDGFSEENEGAGQEMAGEILGSVGETLGRATRQSDLLARRKHGRFSFALLDCNLAGGQLVVDRLDGILDPIRRESGVSFSMGVAAFQRGMEEPEELERAAEEALRLAQSRGGDRAEFSD